LDLPAYGFYQAIGWNDSAFFGCHSLHAFLPTASHNPNIIGESQIIDLKAA